ncbi:E3 ubiquitin/ISG15 ligase TRIM25-like [Sphaeramia orbicularis]|uniref:E3 ubiquitin/ISG15 ligase TRIM25-like n=1 Tax=Sphaeramia orbicularis TaxID=375764 RepID=A0A672YE87_9TELE|nr:E3 ubiquitin/ISG15 ligase TRIM25-like [Sphaeramia orbicularis]
MATVSSFLSEDQFLCSICLEVFTNPVSIPCGHNFCKACISRHWKDKEQCQCPLCKEEFSKGLKLCVNTTFREVVEKFKKNYIVPKNETPVKPEDVLCDCCLDSKYKASKTCLVCLASYCETHLESHLRVPALKRHKLTDPVQNLEKKICRKHNMILESLCSNDPTPACALCIKHDTAPVKKEHEHQKPPMVNKNEEVRGRKGKQRKNAKRKNDKHEAPANSVEDSEDSSDVYLWCNQYFINFSKVPFNSAISKGRFYYEVDIEGQNSWDLGVISESLRWKRTLRPNDMNRCWFIRLLNCSECRARNSNEEKMPQRVWVCVDYDQGRVLFCDADTRAPFFMISQCRFRQKIFLFFEPVPLIKCPPCIKQHMAQKPVDKWLGIFVVFILMICLMFSI